MYPSKGASFNLKSVNKSASCVKIISIVVMIT